jgi:hypothetical protein
MKKILSIIISTLVFSSVVSCASQQDQQKCIGGDCENKKIEILKPEELKIVDIKKSEKSVEKNIKKGKKQKKTSGVNKKKVNRLK